MQSKDWTGSWAELADSAMQCNAMQWKSKVSDPPAPGSGGWLHMHKQDSILLSTFCLSNLFEKVIQPAAHKGETTMCPVSGKSKPRMQA